MLKDVDENQTRNLLFAIRPFNQMNRSYEISSLKPKNVKVKISEFVARGGPGGGAKRT